METFPWKQFGGNHWNNPLAPAVVIEFVGQDGPMPVEGLFDCGADSTVLEYGLMPTLGIGLEHCAAMKVFGVFRPFTVVEARLDGHTFDLPIAFTPSIQEAGAPINLFGRVGILERFKITLDPTSTHTRFSWVEGQEAPVVAGYDNWLVDWLEAHPGGFVEGEDYE